MLLLAGAPANWGATCCRGWVGTGKILRRQGREGLCLPCTLLSCRASVATGLCPTEVGGSCCSCPQSGKGQDCCLPLWPEAAWPPPSVLMWLRWTASQPSPHSHPRLERGLTFRGIDKWRPTPKECRLTLLGNCLPPLVAWGPPEMGPLQGSHRKSPPPSQIPFSFPENLLSLSPPAPRPLASWVTHHAHICWWPPLWDTHLLASVTLGLPGPPTLETPPFPTPQALDTSHMPWSVSPQLHTPLSSRLPKVPNADSSTHSRDPPHAPPGQTPERLRPGSRSLSAKRGHRDSLALAFTSCSPAPSDTQPPPSHHESLCAGNWSLRFGRAHTGSSFPI